MRQNLVFIVFALFSFSLCIEVTANNVVDSLRKFVNETNHQHEKIDALVWLFDEVKDEDPTTAEIYIKKALGIAENLGEKFKQGDINNKLGLFYAGNSDFKKARDYYDRALDLFKQIGNEEMVGVVYNNIGLNYGYQQQLGLELEAHYKALAIFEKLALDSRKAMSYVNIGNIFIQKKDLDKSLEYYEKARVIYESKEDYRRLGTCLNNMALLHYNKEEYEKSYEMFTKTLKVYELLGNERGVTMTLYNSASPLMKMKRYEEAEQNLMRALSILERNNDKSGLAICYNNLGALHNELGNYKAAIAYYLKSIPITRKIKLKQLEIDNYQGISDVYEHLNDYEQAYSYYKKYTAMNDSITTKQIEKINEVERKLIAEKNKQEIELLNKEKEIKNYQTKVTIIVAVALILLLMLGIYGLYKKYQNKNRLNKTLEEKNQLIEEKNKEITDSIIYAKRIQSAILPPDKMLKQLLPNSFVLYKPKDIVAGDFYWLVSHQDKILFAAADCTGHGVPGAMVSVICNSALYQSVREYNLTNPGKILDKTREIVVREFEKSEEEVKDGMDIALCKLEIPKDKSQKTKLEFAGAHNPLWLIRNGELIEYKANKQPIGEFENPKPYQTHGIELQKGDTIYVFSDGYADQFGGEKGKKMKAAHFKSLLLEIQNNSMENQKQLLDEAFERWKGNLEQIDDVCILGVRI